MARKLTSMKSMRIKDEDMLESGIQKQIEKAFSSDVFDEVHLTKEELHSHIIIPNLQGSKVKVRTHTLGEEKMDHMHLIICKKTLNHYFFLFQVTNS